LVTRPATDYVREFTRDVQRAKVISARALMRPAASGASYAGQVKANARVASFAAQIVGADRPFGVIGADGQLAGEVHRDSVVALLAGRDHTA
jgi:glycine betaine/proline transport system ATP-binding protein